MKKILIVEDDISLLKLLSFKLKEKGYQVTEAINGKIGLEKSKNESFDLILLDIKMPVMDGITMLDLLRKDDAGKKMKVILLTNLEPDNKIIKQVIDDQPLYYFIKSDIRLNDLIKKIDKLTAK